MSTVAGPNIVKSGLSLYLDMKNKYSFSSGNTTWNDLTGNNHNGTLMLNPIYNNSVITLDGSSYISIPDSPYINSSVFTFCAWVRNTDNNLNWNRIMSKKLEYTDNNGYEISLSTGTDQTLYIGGLSGSFATISNFCNWFDFNWHYVVVSFSGTDVQGYCDGEYKGSGSIASVISNSRNLSLGRIDGESGTTQWYGDFGVVQMYNKVLSAYQVMQNYNSLKYRYLNNTSVVNSFLETDTSLWLKGDNPLNTNVRWFDSSPNNHILNGTATLTDNVLNGQKGYVFNGISNYFDGGDILDIGLNSRTMIIVSKIIGNNGSLFSKSLAGINYNRYAEVRDGGIYYSVAITTNPYDSNNYADVSTLFCKRISVVDNLINLHYSYLNSEYKGYSSFGTGNSISNYNFLIGAYNNSIGTIPPQSGLYLNGTICEIIFLDRLLTTEEDTEINTYLNTKYGL